MELTNDLNADMAGHVNPTGLSKEELNKNLTRHAQRKWIDRSVESVQPEVDTEETWSTFHFGRECPLELIDGVRKCKSFHHRPSLVII